MQSQIELIEKTDWDVLVVLDACRADYFAELMAGGLPALPAGWGVPGSGSPETRAPGVRTQDFVRAVAPILPAEDVVYYSANPVVDRTVRRHDIPMVTDPLWKGLWGYHGPERIPSVHPQAVTGAAGRDIQTAAQKGMTWSVVIHYLQPHSPYIGRPALGSARWGRGRRGTLYGECHALPRPDLLVKRGEATWAEVRAAYAGNLRLAWEAVLTLLGALPPEIERVAVTGDHGEMLGEEGGRFGHEANWDFPELRRVPFLRLERVPTGDDEDVTTRHKLEALGYA